MNLKKLLRAAGFMVVVVSISAVITAIVCSILYALGDTAIMIAAFVFLVLIIFCMCYKTVNN